MYLVRRPALTPVKATTNAGTTETRTPTAMINTRAMPATTAYMRQLSTSIWTIYHVLRPSQTPWHLIHTTLTVCSYLSGVPVVCGCRSVLVVTNTRFQVNVRNDAVDGTCPQVCQQYVNGGGSTVAPGDGCNRHGQCQTGRYCDVRQLRHVFAPCLAYPPVSQPAAVRRNLHCRS